MIHKCVKNNEIPRSFHANEMRDYDAKLTEDVTAWIQLVCNDLAEQCLRHSED